MTEEKKQPKEKPDYTGNLDVAAWINTDKNGKTFLSVKIGSFANLFKNEQKEKSLK